MKEIKFIQGSDNVFKDLGFDREEAANLKIRADLMIDLREYIRARGWTQAEAADFFGETQPRISNLLKGEIGRFSIDKLINRLARGATSTSRNEAARSLRSAGGRRYLLVSAFIGYQAVKDLLPDALLVLGRDAFLSPSLNSREAVLEGVHVAGRPAFAFQSSHTCSVLRPDDGRDRRDSIFPIYSSRLIPVRFLPRSKIHFPIAVGLWQSSGKAENFD